mmetsp:Transcript_16877/g.42186  ORF Transcript_16877/g.42186 Transcript_16877/m.42186 type:complete len:91 (+) Transcript_16877:379-651(+)
MPQRLSAMETSDTSHWLADIEGGLRASTERWTGSHARPRRDQVGVVSSRLRDQLTLEQHTGLDISIAALRDKKQQETDIGKLRAQARPRP